MKNLARVFLLVALMAQTLLSCAGIPGSKINPKNIKEFSKQDQEILKKEFDVSYARIREGKRVNDLFIGTMFKKRGVDSDSNAKCYIVYDKTQDSSFCPVTNLLAIVSLYIVPYYCNRQHEIKATLITNKNHPSNKGQEKTLAQYHLQENMHEVWSALWMAGAAIIPPLRDFHTPEGATMEVNNKLNKAFVNQVLNDVVGFEECRR